MYFVTIDINNYFIILSCIALINFTLTFFQVHLKEGYGKLIQLYCTLLITKINFHDRNPKFPGNLQLSSEELDAIGENDINN